MLFFFSDFPGSHIKREMRRDVKCCYGFLSVLSVDYQTRVVQIDATGYYISHQLNDVIKIGLISSNE